MAHIVGILVAQLDDMVEHIVVESDCPIMELLSTEFILCDIGYDGDISDITRDAFESFALTEIVKKYDMIVLRINFCRICHNLIVLADS